MLENQPSRHNFNQTASGKPYTVQVDMATTASVDSAMTGSIKNLDPTLWQHTRKAIFHTIRKPIAVPPSADANASSFLRATKERILPQAPKSQGVSSPAFLTTASHVGSAVAEEAKVSISISSQHFKAVLCEQSRIDRNILLINPSATAHACNSGESPPWPKQVDISPNPVLNRTFAAFNCSAV